MTGLHCDGSPVAWCQVTDLICRIIPSRDFPKTPSVCVRLSESCALWHYYMFNNPKAVEEVAIREPVSEMRLQVSDLMCQVSVASDVWSCGLLPVSSVPQRVPVRAAVCGRCAAAGEVSAVCSVSSVQ